jgi:hypothetical protein
MVLSPIRWRKLVGEAGLKPEFVTGSRTTLVGARLVNWRWWVRLNQL